MLRVFYPVTYEMNPSQNPWWVLEDTNRASRLTSCLKMELTLKDHAKLDHTQIIQTIDKIHLREMVWYHQRVLGLVCVCVCVCFKGVHLCMDIHMCVCACVHIADISWHQVCFFGNCHLIFWDSVTHVTWDSFISLDWLLRKLQEPLCVHLPSTGVTGVCLCLDFMWVLGTKFRSLFYGLNHLLRLHL